MLNQAQGGLKGKIMSEALNNLAEPEGYNGETLAGWEHKFKEELLHLGGIKNAFDAMNYVIEVLFPSIEQFNSWRMGNEAVAMQAVSNALQLLNDIKAAFNQCQNPTYWKQDASKLDSEMAQLITTVQTDPALKGISGSIIDQLKLITHSSSFPGLWFKNKSGIWQIKSGPKTWWDGNEKYTGTITQYIEWQWSQEWQGKSPTQNKPSDWYRVTLQKQTNGTIVVTVWHMFIDPKTHKPTYTHKAYSVSQFEAYIKQQVDNQKPIFDTGSGQQNPVYLPNGNVNYWNGNEWVKNVTKAQFLKNFIDQNVTEGENAVNKKPGGPNDYVNINITDIPPGTTNNPKFTTGPTSQAFNAISTTFNSQSSEEQSKFKYLQSNMQQYLGIQHDIMSQIIKEESAITGFTKQQSG